MKTTTACFYLGIIVTFMIMISLLTLLPPVTQIGVPINPDITVRVDPVVDSKKSDKTKKDTIEKPKTEELTKIDKLYTRMQDLEIVLDNIDKSAATLRHLIDSYSLNKTAHRSGKTIPFEQLRIEPFYPYLRSPLWHKYKENQYVEDRSYLEFLAKHYVPPQGGRKILIDLGAAAFTSSVGWFLENYPLTFDEIHAFEAVPDRFIIPPASEIGQHVHNSIRYHPSRVGVADDITTHTIDFSNWLAKDLRPLEYDYVVLKMDVEGAEWDILSKMEKAGLYRYIDELFVEIHYYEPDLAAYGWRDFKKSKDEAIGLLRRWRSFGVYAHYWP